MPTSNEEHECLHEVDFALMQQDIGDIKDDQKEMIKLLKGDNGQGITTTVALHAQSMRRMWWWIGSLSLFIAISAVGVIFRIIQP
jgi:hypothetical protein